MRKFDVKKVVLAAGVILVGLFGVKSDALAYPLLETGVDTSSFEHFQHDVYISQSEANKNEALEALKKIRSEMWDENVLYSLDENPGTRLRDVLETEGITSKEEYVNAISWSRGLESIALQRAFEQLPFKDSLSHTRPDGSSFFTASLKDPSSSGEILASNTRPVSANVSFDQWYSEYPDLLASEGVVTSANGHLHIILDPSFKSFAYASINLDDPNYRFNYGVGEFSRDESNDTSVLNYVGDYTMYLGYFDEDEAEKASTSELIRKLEDALYENKLTMYAAKSLIENYPETVKNIRGQLDALIAESQRLQESAQKILDSLK